MRQITRAMLTVVAIAAAAFAASCSDGDPWTSVSLTPDITPAPMIIAFYADPVKIKAGEGTTIYWEVADADQVQITASSAGAAIPFDVQTTELSGSAPVASLSATTTFTLTATKAAPTTEGQAKAMKAEGDGATPPAETGALSSSQQTTVTVEAPVEIQATIDVDKKSLQQDEQTVLRWTVTPTEGVTVAVAADSGEAIDAKEQCDGDIQAILSQPSAQTLPAAGCAVVAPKKNTTYKVTATDAADSTNAKEASVAIEVAAVELTADILINGQREYSATSASNEVEVSWTVTPADAAVTITADPAVVSCSPELPSGKAVDYTSTTCVLSKIPTFFKIQATKGTAKPAEATASVTQGSVEAGIDVRADEWAFEGETVSVAIDLKPGIDPAAIKEVHLTDKVEGIKKVTGFPLAAPVKVVAPLDGITVSMIDSTGKETPYGTKVRTLATIEDGVGAVAAITKLALDPNDPSRRFTGVMMDGYNGGIARFFIDGSDVHDIDFATALKKQLLGDPNSSFWSTSAMKDYIKTFPVNAIAVRPGDSKKIYIGVTGGVFASSDSGAKFDLVGPAVFVSQTGSDYAGSHETCRGKTQGGVQAQFRGQLVAFNQVCDIVVSKGGRFVVATDMGVFSISDIDKFMTDPSMTIEGNNSILSMQVTDDLECLDAECANLLAASKGGIYKSTDSGVSWQKFGELGKRAYAVVALGSQVFAGAEDGVYVTDAAAASWAKVGLDGSKVLSLAIDPNVGLFGKMIIAGTAKGVSVTRDSGKSWSAIDVGGSAESLSVAIVSTDGAVGAKRIGVTIGSGNKSIHGETEVTKAAP